MTLPPIDEAERRRFVETLSIVLQGPLSKGNVAAVARSCRAWRAMFPVQPIILAISRNDVASADALTACGPGSLRGIGREPEPLDLICEACDEIVLAPPARALPPVKSGVGRNHVNYQIAAARAGLARVRTPHVMRARHDLAFRDDAFVGHYLDRRRLPRGGEALLAERVLISPWFTLDPLTLERLPFHYSDWFHLGRTDDVTALWNVPAMRRRDATYYRRHRMRPESGARERLFRSRWAAEQHIAINALAALGRPVRLDRHDDASDAAASLAILADNFVVADLAVTPLDFAKYDHLARAPDLGLLCVSDLDMAAIAQARGQCPPDVVLARKVAAARVQLEREAVASRRRSLLDRWRR